jgi:hypothetical protein
MNEQEWIEKIKKECVLNVGNFDTRYAIQLIGKPGSKMLYVSINKKFMNVSIIDKQLYEKYYDEWQYHNQKGGRHIMTIDYHIPHTISTRGAKILWDYYYNQYQKLKAHGRMKP